jgi:hypothetical protein
MAPAGGLGHWIWKGPKVNPTDYLGFIYVIHTLDWYYIGRKQIWSTKRGKRIRQTDWRSYRGSSRHLPKLLKCSDDNSVRFEILGFFNTKSFLRYAEAVAIITSLSYERPDRGINYSFAGMHGRLADDASDFKMLQQLKSKVKRLEREYR